MHVMLQTKKIMHIATHPEEVWNRNV